MKKFLSILMVLAMLLSLSITAFAAQTNGSITITNATIDETYSVYKIFDATYDEKASDADNDGIKDNVSYTLAKTVKENGVDVPNPIFQYMFEKDIIFCQKILGGGGADLDLTAGDIAKLVAGMMGGVAKGKIKASTVKKIVTGLIQSTEVTNLYKQYPETPAGYWAWKAKADALWEKIGPMTDICDQEVVKRLGIK